MKFFGKLCGWCWCQGVDMWFSQWLSVACWIDAIGRPEVTTETTRLSASISFGNLMSYFVFLILYLSFQLPEQCLWGPPAVSVCASKYCGMPYGWDTCVRFVALFRYKAESLIPCYSFHNQPLRWNNCTHTINASEICHYLKFTKKGKWKHNA